MIPTPAQELVAQKKILPTTLSHAELAKIDADIRERALFSARVANARFLQEVKDKLEHLLETGASPQAARAELQSVLEKLSYEPGDAVGTIQDLSSDPRINLIVDTQMAMANGFGRWKQGQTKAILNAWPAQELYRAEDRLEPRDWPERWAGVGGVFFPGDSDYEDGRMVALKNSNIWRDISAFGLPYPPFDFNSGMSVRDVDRDTAVSLGLMTERDTFEPQPHSFGGDSGTDVASLDPDIRKALLVGLGSDYRVDKSGVLRRKLSNRAGDDMRLIAIVAVFRYDRDNQPQVLLGKRADGSGLALPGGHIQDGEELESGARREILEETGITIGKATRLMVLPEPGKVIYFYGTLYTGKRAPKAGDETSSVMWADVHNLPSGLAFNNNRLIPQLFELMGLPSRKEGNNVCK